MATKKSVSSKGYSSSSSSSLAPWLGISVIIILIDQITKITITKLLQFGEARPVTSFFNLVLAHNKGAAFSFLASESGWQRYLFTAIAIAAVIFIITLLKKHAGKRLFCWALAMILGGAVGNLIDRVIYGHVVDFLDFYVGQWHWPAFNVADMAIVGGAGLFILDELRRVGK